MTWGADVLAPPPMLHHTTPRRRVSAGGELGGENKNAWAAVMMTLWVIYILVSSLQAEGVINGF